MTNKKVKVAAYTPGIVIPSRRFRVEQYIPLLQKQDVYIKEFFPPQLLLPKQISNLNKYTRKPITSLYIVKHLLNMLPNIFNSYKADIVLFQRALLPGYATLEGLSKKPKIFDVDDAIWLDQPFGNFAARKIAKKMDAVIAGNQFLADWFSDYLRNVYVIPTSIDTDQFQPNRIVDYSKFVIGWTGSSSNFLYLYNIEKILYEFLNDFSDAKLLIIADKKPDFKYISNDKIMFYEWTPEIEAKIIHKMDVGIMPLIDDVCSRGKCSCKMLQYMACGLPVVVSDIGMNTEVLSKGNIGFGIKTEDDWYDAFKVLYLDREAGKSLGAKGRQVVEQYYSIKVNSIKLAELFRSLT